MEIENACSITSKKKERDELAEQIKAFLASGRTIEVITNSAPIATRSHRPAGHDTVSGDY